MTRTLSACSLLLSLFVARSASAQSADVSASAPMGTARVEIARDDEAPVSVRVAPRGSERSIACQTPCRLELVPGPYRISLGADDPQSVDEMLPSGTHRLQLAIERFPLRNTAIFTAFSLVFLGGGAAAAFFATRAIGFDALGAGFASALCFTVGGSELIAGIVMFALHRPFAVTRLRASLASMRPSVLSTDTGALLPSFSGVF